MQERGSSEFPNLSPMPENKAVLESEFVSEFWNRVGD